MQAEVILCNHCGESCNNSIIVDDRVFCCYGCKSVHELLKQTNLSDYYSETSIESKSLSQIKAERKYSFLDNEDIQRQLLRYKDDRQSTIHLSLPAIHCSSCIHLLEHLPRLENSIKYAQVNFIKREIIISWNHSSTSLKKIVVLLSQLGYPPDISLDSLDRTKQYVIKSKMGMKIAVAGFCFGNAMLMSMPAYLDHNSLLTEEFKQLFGWINLVLVLPVMIFSGNDYFIKAWKGLRIGKLNIDIPIALGMLTLFGRSVFEILTHSGDGYMDSLAGLVFFLLIGKWYQGKTYQALSFERDYASYFPVTAICLIDGKEYQRPLKELKKGDQVIIHNDEIIPADGRIIRGIGNIDYSFVTGESKPITKQIKDVVYAGGRQKGTELVIEVIKSVVASELTLLWNNIPKKKQSLATFIDRIGHYFTLAIILIAILTAIYWYIMDPTVIWNATTAVLIVACPCALALTLPFAYGCAMRVLGKQGLYLKNADVIETLSKVNSIIFDKTGTLTESHPHATYFGTHLSNEHVQLLKSVLSNSAHPLSRIIHASLPTYSKLPLETFEEVVGQGIVATIIGNEIKIGSRKWLGIGKKVKSDASHVHISINGYMGYFEIKSRYRKGIFNMLKHLKRFFTLSLLSGDNHADQDILKPYFDSLHFEHTPSDKLNFISRKDYTHHLMVGDGLNDAGALCKAEVGIAISEDIYRFSPACDAILSAAKIASLPDILKFSKAVKYIVYIALGLSFLYNIIGLSFAISGYLTPSISAILMPISSVSVVSYVTLMVNWKGSCLNSNSQ